jgi:hypothetical protein
VTQSVRWKLIAIFPAVLGLCACNSKTDVEKVWIVPKFATQDGHAIEMAFNNPLKPDMTLAECEASLNEQTRRVVDEARAREPALLSKAKLSGIRCVSAVGNPIAPSDGAK